MLKKQSFEELCIWPTFLLCFSFKLCCGCCCCLRCDDFLAKINLLRTSVVWALFFQKVHPPYHIFCSQLSQIVKTCCCLFVLSKAFYTSGQIFFFALARWRVCVKSCCWGLCVRPVSFYLGSNFWSRKHVSDYWYIYYKENNINFPNWEH